MSSGRRIHIKGFRMKDGKPVPDERRLDVSARIKQRTSKKVRVVRKGKAKP